MRMTMHGSLSVRGALNWDRSQSKKNMKWLLQKDGKPFPTVEAMRDALMDALAEGQEYICMSKCDNFDPKTGCKGHEKP